MTDCRRSVCQQVLGSAAQKLEILHSQGAHSSSTSDKGSCVASNILFDRPWVGDLRIALIDEEPEFVNSCCSNWMQREIGGEATAHRHRRLAEFIDIRSTVV